MTERRVVVTGIGTINPLGNNIEEYFSNLEKGVSGAAPITHFDAEKFKTKFACEVKNYDSNLYFDRKEVRKYDLFTQYALIAATQAVEDSALDLETVDKEQVGVIWSSGIGGIKSFFDECLGWAAGDGTPRFSPFFIPRMISDIAAGFISMKYGFMGPNYCTVSACASSNHGMIAAFDAIRYGKADVMVAGGSEAAVNEPSVGGFNSMQALSTRNDDPQHASRPFDKDRDGFVIGEGAGALIFEEYEHAKARGAKIYCEIIGGGASADAYHFTAPHPEGKGAMKSMRDAIKDAGIKPEDIDYVNVHGTSTPAGDIPELKAVAGVLGDHVYNVNISSTKSMTGHLLGAAGAAEALACIFAITHGVVPPTINCENLDPEIDPNLNLTLNKAQKRDVKCALSNTFGFGGHNSSIIFRKVVDDMFGFIPNNIELYKLALIHKSASLVLEDGRPINNERLEFLGDAVIEAVTSDYLFIEYPDRDEGFLTQLRSKIVSRQSLNELAVKIGLDRHVISNASTSITQKHIYGDAFEAMIGAVYLDQGYEFTNRLLINRIYFQALNLDELTESETDFKSRLIEWCQKNHLKIVFRTGNDKEYSSNHPVFYSTVLVDGIEVGHGSGESKKEAEQHAAFSVAEYMTDEQCASLLDRVDRLTQ